MSESGVQLRVVDLRKAYGELVAVDGVSFEVHPGEVFGLLGPNGAGKTTVVEAIVGLVAHDAGSIELEGDAGVGTEHRRRRIGLAPQKLSLYDRLTAAENLELFAEINGLFGERRAERVEWALDLAELQDRRDDPVAEFSGGMKRRLNLASAAVHAPDLLILDEPTVGVDAQSRTHILERIEQLRDTGVTILYTTHYMEEAERLCDRVAIMDQGRILAVDEVDALVARHGGATKIRVDVAGGADLPDDLPVTVDEGELHTTAMEPAELFRVLEDRGVDYRECRIARPDLETVFLNLTGRQLRE